MKARNTMMAAAIAGMMTWGIGCGSKPAAETAGNAVAPASAEAPGSPAAGSGAAGGSGAPVAAKADPVVKRIAPAPPPRPLVLDAGTSIKVRSTSTLSTKNNAAGDAFHGSLEAPLTVDGKVVAEKGAKVQGVVAESDPGGRVKGVAAISVRLTAIETAKGMVSVKTNAIGREARTTKRNDAVKVGIASGVGAAIGAIAGGGRGAAIGAGAGAGAGTGVVLATRGEAAVLPAETVLTFKLADDVAVK
ncbi:MAG: hypothetical protein JNK48_04280 [Bryobacterales bacterium]|nr:hypothetical protein [Bryobacterales bacterium]